jgi:probable selenium-dependent hydroxylase accessory protein YqeC
VDPNLKTILSITEEYVENRRGTGEREEVLSESLRLGPKEIISLVGAGGKTTLMFRLARELAAGGKRVVTTTTTRILEPSPTESSRLFVSPARDEIGRFLDQHLCSDRHITVAQERLGSGKLKGIPPDFVEELSRSEGIEYVIVEADGAAGHPVKAPREGEPVIPRNTTLTVALMGVDGLGVELREENIFRSERAAHLTGLALGSRMTEQALAVLITHAEGILKGTPEASRIIVFLNKVDIVDGVEKGERIARSILDQGHPGIERILLGQLKEESPVVRIFLGHQSF